MLFFSLKYHIEKDKDDIAKMEKILHDKFVISEISWNTFSPLARKPRKTEGGFHSYPKLAKHAKYVYYTTRLRKIQYY